MKKYFALLILSVILIMTLACSKDTPEPDYAAGHVLEYGTDKPLSGAKVYLAACSGDFLGPIFCEIIDSATALSDGSFTMKPGGSLVEAHMPGYFTDWESQKTVTTQPEDIRLYPHAWLRVKLKNESGAWGFYPERAQAWLPPIQLPIGSDSIFIDRSDLRKGNTKAKYLFSIIQEENGNVPSSEYWKSKVRFMVNGNEIPFNHDIGGVAEFYLLGHDTTDITIIY